MQKLRVFFHRCVRSMNDVDMEKTRRHRLTSYELQKRMGLRTIESYVSEPALRWLGHVARMAESSLPKKLLAGWHNSCDCFPMMGSRRQSLGASGEGRKKEEARGVGGASTRWRRLRASGQVGVGRRGSD